MMNDLSRRLNLATVVGLCWLSPVVARCSRRELILELRMRTPGSSIDWDDMARF